MLRIFPHSEISRLCGKKIMINCLCVSLMCVINPPMKFMGFANKKSTKTLDGVIIL